VFLLPITSNEFYAVPLKKKGWALPFGQKNVRKRPFADESWMENEAVSLGAEDFFSLKRKLLLITNLFFE
jgi:hypothetical protein